MITSFNTFINEAKGLGWDAYSPDDLGKILLDRSEKKRPPLKMIQDLINHGADLNIHGSRNRKTALHWSAQYNTIDLAKLLIDSKASLDAQDSFGQTPLHIAAEQGHLEIAKALIAAGANIDAQTFKGFTPLHYAAEYAHVEVIMLLIDAGARRDLKTENGRTPWEVVDYRILKNVPELRKQTKGSDLDDYSPEELGKMIIERCRLKHPPIKTIENLIAHGAAIDTQDLHGFTALELAVQHNHVEVVQALLKAGASIAKRPGRWDILQIAAWRENVDILRILLNAGAAIDIRNEDGSTVLYYPVVQGNLEVVKILIEAGVDLNVQDKFGRTALHLAAENGHPEILRLLINSGVSKDVKTRYGETPWDIANEEVREKVPELKP